MGRLSQLLKDDEKLSTVAVSSAAFEGDTGWNVVGPLESFKMTCIPLPSYL